MPWTLIGQPDSKRTTYFIKAAKELGLRVNFVDIESCDLNTLRGQSIKIDPPVYSSSNLSSLPQLTAEYIDFLKKLARQDDLHFLNHPDDIIACLDKLESKKRLMDNGVSTTPLFSSSIAGYNDLLEEMILKQVYQVFIKPNIGSGAAGIIALRIHPKLKSAFVAYTSVITDGTDLFNSKRIKRVTSELAAEIIVNAILRQGAIIEEWVPKATHKGLGYDLRVVWQFGKIAFVVPRFSETPITNLHLNNKAGAFEELQLSDSTISQVERICDDTMKLFPKLSYAGIDILLTKDSLQPMVIEVNGQGDLIYQDIYAENLIYKQQLIGEGKSYHTNARIC